MSHRICCYTLFNITHTGVLNRSRPNEDNVSEWLRKRNTQCNFDTVLQAISLRSQPEVVKVPIRIEMQEADFIKFGFLYNKEDKISYYWKFEFEVQHASVFENGIIPLGALYNDCNGIPMILCEDQLAMLSNFLDTSSELKNIHFEVT
jgi:hypothetical protein